jgi:hypothetical protein
VSGLFQTLPSQAHSVVGEVRPPASYGTRPYLQDTMLRTHGTEPIVLGPTPRAELSSNSGIQYPTMAPKEAMPVPLDANVALHTGELARLRGAIVGKGAGGTTVRVQFFEPDSTVEFPTELFAPGLAKYGQVIDYVVRRRADGFQVQSFEAGSAKQNPSLAELERLLSGIDR